MVTLSSRSMSSALIFCWLWSRNRVLEVRRSVTSWLSSVASRMVFFDSSLSAPWNETTTPASGGATMVALAGARRTRCAGARKGQQESSKIALSARRLIISSLPCFAALISSALPVDLLRVSVSEQVRSGVAIAIQCIAMALVAVFLADRRGFSLFDPLFLIPFACLAALLVAPILVTMHRAGDQRRAFVRIGIAVGRACGA